MTPDITTPDTSLLENYRSTGNTAVIESLYLRYSHLVYLVCLKYLRNPEDSKDAVMDIFQKLLVDCRKYSITHFPAWLHAVTKNYCLMRLRKPDHALFQSLPPEELAELDMETEIIDTLTEKQGLDIGVLLDRLKTEQKRCIRLFYFENKSYQEIARITQMEVRQVKSHLQNGKRNLRGLINKQNGTEL